MEKTDWKPRTDAEPGTDCIFYIPANCVGFTKCKDCDFHDLEPTKSKIIGRINYELKEINRLGKSVKELEANKYTPPSETEVRKIAFEILDKFRGVQIMNGVLNSKFGFKIPDIHSFAVKRMVKKLRKGKEL